MEQVQAANTLDAHGRVVMPGFVDPHTHLAWAGERATSLRCALRGELPGDNGRRRGDHEHGAPNARRKRGDWWPRPGPAWTDAGPRHDDGGDQDWLWSQYADELKQLQPSALQAAFRPRWCAPFWERTHPGRVQGPDGHTWTWWWRRCCRRWSGGCPPAFLRRVLRGRRILAGAVAARAGGGPGLGFGLKIHVDEFKPLGGTRLAVELGACRPITWSARHPRRSSCWPGRTPSPWGCPAPPLAWGTRVHAGTGPHRCRWGRGLATDCNPAPAGARACS